MMRALFLAAGIGLLPLAAQAQAIDFSKGGPVEVTSKDGFEWRENEQEVIATGDARAVRDNVTVTADKLIAYYRKKAGSGPVTPASATAPATAPAASAPGGAAAPGTPSAGEPDTGSTEIYRLEADGNVHIFTPTDEAVGDHAVYDIDQAVLVLTGKHLKLTTPQQVLTARDSMEYWSAKHMAVGRGDAVVVTSDGRRLAADTLVGFTTDPNDPNAPAQPKPAAPAPKPGAAPADPIAASGKLQRVEAYGNVEVRTAVDIVRGDRGLYLPDTGIARVVGHVRITHGQNQLAGPAADVNMKTGIAHLVSVGSQRVQGLIVPNDTSAQAAKSGTAGSGSPASGAPAAGSPASGPAATSSRTKP